MSGVEPDPAEDAAAVVRRPAEVLRLASATREVLEELRNDGLSVAARRRATALYDRSVQRLGDVISDDLSQELTDLTPARPAGGVPSTDELRVVDAQLTGWLDGLLQTLQASVVAQAQEDQRSRAAATEAPAEAAERDGRRRDTSYL
ncbi:MAG: proteasome activator [Acidimicrobiales bacterium]